MTAVQTKSAYGVNVTASGSSVFENGNNWRMLDVTVTGQANAAPVLASIGPKSVNELAALSFTATASDADIGTGGDSGRFDVVNGNELNMTSVEAKSAYEVNVTASGTDVFENGNNWRMLDVTVTGQANAAPVLASIGPKSVNELAALSFTATASDADNDTLEFTLAGTPPSGASITSGGAFSWTPSESQDGTHAITIQVEDGNGGSDSEAHGDGKRGERGSRAEPHRFQERQQA